MYTLFGFVIATFLGLVAFHFTGKRFFWKENGIPQLSGWPFVGIFPSLGLHLHKDLYRLFRKYGDIFMCKIGRRNVLVVTKYEILDELFRKRQGTFNNLPFGLPENLDIPVGITELQYCDKWQELRRHLLNFLYSKREDENWLEKMVSNEVSKLTDYIQTRHQAQGFYPAKILIHFIGNILLYILYRERMEYDDGDLIEELYGYSEGIQKAAGFYTYMDVPIYALRMFGILDKHKEIFQSVPILAGKLYSFSASRIAAHKPKENVTPDFLEYLRERRDTAKAEGKPTFLNDNTILGLCNMIITAGLDSTGITVKWLVHFLAKYPEEQQKAREEILRVLSSGKSFEAKDRGELHYVKALILETNRLANIGPLGVMHVSSKEEVYKNTTIPEGTIVIANMWAGNHDERRFPDPCAFKPERYLDGEGNFTRDKNVLVFSAGRRACPGAQLVEMELSAFLVALLPKFYVKLEEGVDPASVSIEGVCSWNKCHPPEVKVRFVPITN